MRTNLGRETAAFGAAMAMTFVLFQTPTPAIRVSVDGDGKQFVETVIAANPRKPTTLIAAAIVLRGGGTSVSAYSTADGGDHWHPAAAPPNDTSRADAIDPWVTFTADGTALFAYLTGKRTDNFAVSRSRDGGRTWSAPTFVPGGLYDRQYLVEDASASSRFQRTIYGIGKTNITRLGGQPFQAIAISISTDAASTFSSPLLFVPPEDNEPLMVVASPVVARNGSLLVPFTTVIRPSDNDPTLNYGLWTIRSSDGGRTFTVPSLVARRVVPRSEAQRQASTPSMALDMSGGPTDGRVYLTWSQPTAGGYDIDIWRSADSGVTWSPGVRVNDNAQPAAHVNPAVAVNAHGAVVVAWYDRRAHNNPVCHSLWIAASIDGGRTFSKNRPVTDVKTCIQSQRFANGGDTLGLVADAVGAFHTAFISGANPTEVQLYAARLILDSQQRR